MTRPNAHQRRVLQAANSLSGAEEGSTDFFGSGKQSVDVCIAEGWVEVVKTTLNHKGRPKWRTLRTTEAGRAALAMPPEPKPDRPRLKSLEPLLKPMPPRIK